MGSCVIFLFKSPDVKIQSKILILENVNDITLLAISPRSIVQALCFLATFAKSSEKTV